MDILSDIITAAVPVLILLFGGRRILNIYDVRKTKREQEIELSRFIREQQYSAIQELYGLFGRFMLLYRLVNSPDTDLNDDETRRTLYKASSEAESGVEAVILRIGCEFTHDNRERLEPLLGDLRQSVQIWRESIRAHEKLPFDKDTQQDYLDFKTGFAKTTAYMVSKVYGNLTPEEVQMEEAQNLLIEAFSNKYEKPSRAKRRSSN